MINIFVSDKIIITGLDPEGIAAVEKTLTIPNPMFHKLLAMKKPLWGVPKEYKYYISGNNSIAIPRGMRTRFITWCEKKGLKYSVTEVGGENEKVMSWKALKFKGELREYQKPIVDQVITHTEGVINMGTGTGKTVVGLVVASKLRQRTTVLVPNNVLLSQFRTACRNFFEYEPGIINGEEKTIGEVTIATYQSLGTNPELLAELARRTGTLIVDECQGAVTDQRLEIINAFMPKHLYGLSATPARAESDGRTKAIFMVFGNVIAEYLPTQCTPKVHIINTKTEFPADEYHRMIENMVRHEGRNKLITATILGEALAGKKVLVLTKRIEHYQNLRKYMPDSDMYKYIDSDDKDRNDRLERMKNGDEDFTVIFGTVSLLAVGTDIPQLDTLIIACDMKEDTLTTQSIGRILRLFEGKPEPKVIDIVDNYCPVFKRQAQARARLYQAKGWKII